MFHSQTSRILLLYLVQFSALINAQPSNQPNQSNKSQTKISRELSNKQTRALKYFSDKANHEVSSPSILDNALYLTSTAQQQYAQQIELDGGHQAAAVALGAENHPSQFIMANENQNVPSDVISTSPSMYSNQQMAMISSDPQANQQQQILASLYIDQFGNQQLRLPPGAKVGPPVQMNADSINKNFYSPQQGPNVPTASSATLYSNMPYQPSHYQFSSLMGPQNYGEYRGAKSGHEYVKPKPKFTEDLTLKPSAHQKTLSNGQLMSLIDELKDYNSRQATKVEFGNAAPGIHKNDELVDDGDENIDIDPSFINNKHSDPASEPAERAATREKEKKARKKAISTKEQKSEEKVSPDDIAQFAKFLMTKEGSNMRFQLGLEKDSPDDGDIDEDDKDALLESKKSQLKTIRERKRDQGVAGGPRETNELNELDQKHSDVARQMDSLLEDLTGNLGKITKEDGKKTKRRKHMDSSEELEPDDLRARSRRNSKEGVSSTAEKTTIAIRAKPPLNEQPRPERRVKYQKGHEENFAKQLIRQELVQDQLESKINNSRLTDSTANHQRAGSYDVPRETNPTKSKKRRNIDFTQISGGEENQNYPRPARDRDHVALIHDRQKARDGKSRLRSGVSAKKIVNEPIVRKALSGQVALRTESYPKGKLVPTTSQSGTLKPPKKSISSTRVTPAFRHNDDGQTRDADKTFPSQVESPESRNELNRVRIESDSPLKDEYRVSERVSNRLNLLSNNLDRYFNDGFLNGIENKSKLKESKPEVNDDRGEKQQAENQQADSSNVNEAAANEQSAGRRDPDFDVNVTVDGKREAPEKDDVYYEDDDEENATVLSIQKENRSPVVLGKNRSNKSLRRLPSKSTKMPESKAEVSSIDESKVSSLARKPSDNLGDNEHDGGSSKQNLFAGDEHLTFESRDNKVTNLLDPVEGETFDSPIGPDANNLDFMLPPVTGKKVESSRESKKVATKYGYSQTPEFYEEGEW